MAVGRPPARLELAETSHKIKSAKMRSRAEMKLAMQTLDRQMRITRVSSDMQQARMREHLEDLLLASRRLAADANEAPADRRAHTAATAGTPSASASVQRSRERPVVAPSLSEEHAFRERLLRRLQLLHSMRLPSNYSKRLLSDEEQTVIDLGATPSPENVKSALAEFGRRPRTSPGKILCSARPEAVHTSAAAAAAADGRGSGLTDLYDKVEDLAAAADALGARQTSGGGGGGSAPGKVDGGSCDSNGAGEKPIPRPSPPPGGVRGRGGVTRAGGRSAQSARRSLRSAQARSARTQRRDGESGDGGASETQLLLAERLRRFYDSLGALRRLSISDLLAGLRRLSPAAAAAADASFGELGDGDDLDEATLHKEYRDLLGYCKKSATSLTWKSLAKAL